MRVTLRVAGREQSVVSTLRRVFEQCEDRETVVCNESIIYARTEFAEGRSCLRHTHVRPGGFDCRGLSGECPCVDNLVSIGVMNLDSLLSCDPNCYTLSGR
jgi:hypothetical protein